MDRSQDTTDAVLPGVTVTAVHVESGNSFVGVLDTDGPTGLARFERRHSITVELSASPRSSAKNRLLLGQQAIVNFQLPISGLQESVAVTGESPLIDVRQSKMGSNVDPRQMQALPLNGRNWMELTMLASGSRSNDVGESPYGPTRDSFS